MRTPSHLVFKAGRNAGFTIVETVFSLGIAGMALASVMMLNSHQLRLVKSTRATNAASLSLEERVEQFRMGTWDQLIDPNHLKTAYFATAPRSAAPLSDFTESVTISAYPDPAACPKLVVEKTRGAVPKILSNGVGLALQHMARIDLEMRWKGDYGRPRSRQFVTIVSNGGVARSNLPAMGSVVGARSSRTSLAPPPVSIPPTPAS